MLDVIQLLNLAVEKRASDLHLVVGVPPSLRVDGQLFSVSNEPIVTNEFVEKVAATVLKPDQFERFKVNKDLDFSFYLGDSARFRVNAYFQKGSYSFSFRVIPSQILTIEELGLPTILHSFTKLRQGLVLITGPTGHGKSTTLASILDEINRSRSEHIVTIEDPIEFIIRPDKSIISQREVGFDTHSWQIALRSVLREDPNVVMIGEMRDLETISAALTVAETGHLVFATLHTNSASQTIDRIVDVFPENQQGQIRLQLSNTIEGVFSMRLLPAIGGGRVVAYELMLGTPAVRSVIREGKTHLLDNIIQTSQEFGMSTLEMSLAQLVKEGKVSIEVAQSYSLRPDELLRLVKGEV
ncbi:MAG: twitching motility protein PilT [Patescibacteria group bacterium]|nr:MAG: twitching motility protein PilT [Patescibacteria group bacterium]